MDNGYVIPFAVCPEGRRDYFCSWTCYKTAKRKMLYQKKKLSDEERNWLKWAEGK